MQLDLVLWDLIGTKLEMDGGVQLEDILYQIKNLKKDSQSIYDVLKLIW